MHPFVVDASLTLSWCFVDEATPYTQSVLRALESSHAIVPAHWSVEVANALALAERKGRITTEGVEAFLLRLHRLPILIDRREPQLLWQSVLPLARALKLTAYDAAYLELARRERLALATLDKELRNACGALGVPVAAPP